MPSAHAVEKQRLRRAIRAWRDQLAAHDRNRWSAAICDHLRQFAPFSRARSPALFWGMPTEVDLAPLADARCVWPVVVGRGCALALRRGLPRFPGPYGILEPSADDPAVSHGSIDLVVFPGMAFDAKGHRLGHGAGYYDRTFANTTALRVGVCFAAQLVPAVPVDEWDLPMHVLITEEGLQRVTEPPPGSPAARLLA